MNKLVCSALAASVVGATGFAGTGTDSWASLDRELEALSATLSAQHGGPRIGGWLITSVDYVEDGILVDEGPPLDVDDELGFRLRSARIRASGDVGDYGYAISFDLADGTADLKDAYATFRLGDVIHGQMGNFKPPTLSSHLIERNRLLFLDRTLIGGGALPGTTIGELAPPGFPFGHGFERDLGLQVSGDFETVGWWLAIHNGASGTADDYLITARVAVNLMGDGVGAIEGAYGAPDDMALTLAAFFQDEGFLSDGVRIGFEARLTAGPFYAAAEIVDNDDEVGDNTPWNITLSYLFTEEYEAAVRWEDLDDDDDTNRISVGLNRYIQGHDIKWTLQFSTGDSDEDLLESNEIALGLSVSF